MLGSAPENHPVSNPGEVHGQRVPNESDPAGDLNVTPLEPQATKASASLNWLCDRIPLLFDESIPIVPRPRGLHSGGRGGPCALARRGLGPEVNCLRASMARTRARVADFESLARAMTSRRPLTTPFHWEKHISGPVELGELRILEPTRSLCGPLS